MSTHKYIDLICVAVLVCTLLVTVLFINGERLGIQAVVDGDSIESSDSAFFTRNDRNGDWDPAGATEITLLGDHARISGGGAYAYDNKVVLAQAGRYRVSGALEDGTLVVSADSRAKVWIMLDGVDIVCADDACLRIDEADKVFLTLADGSENSMTGGEVYSDEAVEAGRSGVIASRDDLTINGAGSLRITAGWKHGIDANDDLVITGGTITIEAPGDALHVNDSLRTENAALTLKAGDEGVQVQNAESLLYIASGSLTVDSTGAGLKGAGTLLLEGGSVDLRSEGDGIHMDESVTVTDGTLRIASGDDGIHADKAVTLAGGSVTVSECYEGIEALTIDMRGGEVSIYPSDDGLNANGGSDMFGPGMWNATPSTETNTDEETWIHISGGTLTVVNNVARDADGLDSNGDILISGGKVFVSLTSAGSNSAIDYGSESGGVCEITGGEVVACGSAMMAEGFSDTSTQCSVLYNLGYNIQAETEIRLEDSAGQVLLRYTPPCTFSSVSLSAPGMELGGTYTLVIGEKEEQITLETVASTYGDLRSGGFGANGGFGRPQRDESMQTARPENMGENMGPRPSDMPQRPEGRGSPTDFAGMMPGFDGERPDIGAMPDFNGGQPGQAPAEENAADVTAEIPTGPQPVSRDTWFLLEACALVLILGLLFAIRYKR